MAAVAPATLSPTEQKVQDVLEKLLKDKLDQLVLSYSVGRLADSPHSSATDVYDVLGELLVSYDAVPSDNEAKTLCQKIATSLGGGKSVPKAAAAESSRVEAPVAPPPLGVGSKVTAQYFEDKQWYPATIRRVTARGSYVVLFTEYGNEEEVTAAQVRALEGALVSGSSRKLAAPITIGHFSDPKAAKEKKKARDKEKLPSKSADALAKKEKAKEQRIAKRDEAIRKREELRKQRAEQRKQEALRTYLTSNREIRSMDVDIPNFNMSTIDFTAELLKDSHLKFVVGRRYGLIGRNGVGKSTLLQAIANYEIDKFPTHVRVALVEQEITGDQRTVLRWVLESDLEREMLLKEEARLKEIIERAEKQKDAEAEQTVSLALDALDPKQASERLNFVYNRLNEIDAWSAEARAATILAGLGFSTERQQMPTKALSGGWRMRVALASALFIAPDLLLLDEPTNHLDFPAVLWLEDYLNKYKKTLILVSHDREFVNNVITDVVHFNNFSLEYYKGNYDQFEKTRMEKLKNQKRAFEAQQLKRAHIQKFVDKFRYNAKRASLAQSRLKVLDRMELLSEVIDDPTWNFSFPEPEPIRNFVVQCTNVDFGYDPKHPLLERVSLTLDTETRIGVVGANGVGKSTLIKLLVGDLEATNGQIIRNPHARIAVFAQHHMDQLDMKLTSIEQMRRMFPQALDQEIRGHLGKFGITDKLALQKLRTLSGGQKSRVAFAIVTWKRPHLIIMDEPTNHLDMETIEALIMAVNQFGGGVMVVSHDQHFLNNCFDTFLGVARKRIAVCNEFDDAKKFCYS